MWETLLGGFLALVGGCIAIFLQSRFARKNKMNEIIAERKVIVDAQAYAYVKEIKSLLIQKGTRSALEMVLSREEWFFNNRLFLPGEFPKQWIIMRNALSKLTRREEGTAESTEELSALNNLTENACNKALYDIFKDMGIKPITLNDNNT